MQVFGCQKKRQRRKKNKIHFTGELQRIEFKERSSFHGFISWPWICSTQTPPNVLSSRKAVLGKKKSSEWREKWPYQWSSKRRVKYLLSPREDFFLLWVGPCGDQETLLANSCPSVSGLITQARVEKWAVCVCVCVHMSHFQGFLLYLGVSKCKSLQMLMTKLRRQWNPLYSNKIFGVRFHRCSQMCSWCVSQMSPFYQKSKIVIQVIKTVYEIESEINSVPMCQLPFWTIFVSFDQFLVWIFVSLSHFPWNLL